MRFTVLLAIKLTVRLSLTKRPELLLVVLSELDLLVRLD